MKSSQKNICTSPKTPLSLTGNERDLVTYSYIMGAVIAMCTESYSMHPLVFRCQHAKKTYRDASATFAVRGKPWGALQYTES